MVLVVRFYLRQPSSNDVTDVVTSDSDALVAWGTLPLLTVRHGAEIVNVGTHVVRLFELPVPDVEELPDQDHYRPKFWKR